MFISTNRHCDGEPLFSFNLSGPPDSTPPKNMLAYDFCGFEGFKARFGLLEHGNGEKSRRNKILLSFIKSKSVLNYCRETGDYSLVHISNIADLKKILFERIQESASHDISLKYRVNLINYNFFSNKYETDASNGLCEDGDFKACRYINNANNKGIFKMKAGKFIRSLILETEFGKILPEQAIVFLMEEFCQDWETFSMSTLPKNRLYVNKDFRKIYDGSRCGSGFHSCMIDQGLHGFYADAVDASAAYLEDESGKIIARCIIFNKVYEKGSDKIWRLAERQYATEESNVLKRALVDALIRGGYIDGYKQVGFDCHNSRGFVDTQGNSLESREFYIDCDLETDDTLSYQDSFKWYNYRDRLAFNYEDSSFDYCLDTTEGSIDGKSEDEDDDDENYDSYHDSYTYSNVVYVYVQGIEMTCSDTRLEDFVYIDNQGWVHEDDISICPVCGKRFITNEGKYSELTDETYCSIECLGKAETEYKTEKEMAMAV